MTELKQKKDKLTGKNYLLGMLLFLIIFLLFGWAQSKFSVTYFTNWKMLLTFLLTGFGFGLIFVPFGLAQLSVPKEQKKLSFKKRALLTGVFFVVILAANLIGDAWGGEKIDFSTVIVEIIIAAFLSFPPF